MFFAKCFCVLFEYFENDILVVVCLTNNKERKHFFGFDFCVDYQQNTKKNMFIFVFINWHIAFKSKFSKALFLFRKHPFLAIHFVQYITEQHSTFSVLYWLLSFAHSGHCEMYHHLFLCVHFPISSDAMSLTKQNIQSKYLHSIVYS